MKFANQRQINIIFNALQFIDDVVKNPCHSVGNGVDLGLECRLSPDEQEKPEYAHLLEVSNCSLLSQLQLNTKHSVFEMERFKRRFEDQTGLNRDFRSIN